MRQNLDPLIGQAFAIGKKEQITEMAGKVRKRFWPLISLLGLVLVIGFPALIWLLAKETAVWQSWCVFTILVAGIVISSGYRPFIGLLLQGGRPGTFTVIMAGSVLLNALLNFLLIPWFGISGSAIATAVVFNIEAFVVVMLAKRLFGSVL
jgi:Na+-driven multidrug efflux pump